MKKSYILIAVAMIAALSMTGCKNNKKSQEPTQEEIQEQKQELADSVLTMIDKFTEEYFDATSRDFRLKSFQLTDAEKMVKPDYLLKPSVANTFVTKSQKINALAIYYTEYSMRIIYDMPLDEAKEAMGRLAADLNHPLDLDSQLSDKPKSVKIREEYQACKERGDLAYFWQFHNAIIEEFDYLIAQNPDLFFSRISEDQWKGYYNRKIYRRTILEELSKYDDEIREVWKLRNEASISKSPEDRKVKFGTLEAARHTYSVYKDNLIARRNALLQ